MLKPLSRAAALLMMLTTSAGLAAAPASKPLAPTGKWVVNFADDQCLASRSYGTPGKPLYLALKPSPLGEVMRITILQKGAVREPTQVPVVIRFDDHETIKSSMLAFASPKDGFRILSINLSADQFATMRQAKLVSFRSPGEFDRSLALVQMEPLMKAIDSCVTSLQKYWNISDDETPLLRTRARTEKEIATYLSDDDYPAVAVRNVNSGTVRIAMLIDENGKVADCMTIATSGVASLDAQSCATIAKRAKFVPAIGADGKPAKDAILSSIRWLMPK